MKILIFGAGSIGCYVGGKLLSAGHDVILYGRPTLKKTIHQHGLLLSSYTGENIHLKPEDITYTDELDSLRTADIILLTVKSQATIVALEEIKQYAHKNACVISLQNGVYNERYLKQSMPDWHTAGAMVAYNVVNKGDGHFHRGTEGELIFERSYQTGLLKEFCNKAGLEASLTDNIQGVLWGKLLMNLNNALNVLSNQPLKTQLADRHYRQVLALCIEEALGILKQANIQATKAGKVPPKHITKILRLPNKIFQIVASGMLKIDPEARSSMWEDLKKGRESEIEYLNGEILKLSKANNNECPINSFIIELVKEAFQAKRSPEFSGRALLELVNNL